MPGIAVGRGFRFAAGAVLGAATGLALVAALVQAKPATPPGPETTAAVSDAWASETELRQLTGAAAERCVHAGPHRKLCSWTLSGRLLRADGARTGTHAKTVNLICELPVQDAGDARGPCWAHARGDRRPAEPGADLPHVSARGSVTPTEREALWKELSDARNVTALSHLMGAVPDFCRVRLLSDQQRCEWRIAPDEGRLAALAPAEGAAVLRCALPIDGSDRAPTSCGIVRVD